MASNIDWKAFLSQFIAAIIPLLIAAIVNWLKEATEVEAIAVGRKAGKAYNAFKAA